MGRVAGVLAALLLLLAAPHSAAAVPATRSDASAALARSLATAEQRVGPTAPELLPILAPLAQLRFENAEFAEATALRRRALKIAIANYGSSSAEAAQAMAALAHLYVERRRYLDAEPLALAAANIFRDRPAQAGVGTAPDLADRARIALARGDDGRARKWAEQAIEIDQRNGGAAHGDRLRALGAVLAAEGKFADSENALRQALALDRAQGDQLAAARSLAQLGNAYLRQKRFAEALPLVEEAALIDQDHLGPDHPLIAEDFHDIGLIYLATNRPGDAAKVLRAAAALLERGAGRDTPTLGYVELDLARAEHALGHEDKAQALFNSARRILNIAEDEERDRQREA